MSVDHASTMDAVTTPSFIVEGRRAIFLPQLITNIPRSALGPLVANLAAHGGAIIRALDQVLSRGYLD
ncbi:MAG: CcdB family protein [Niveispirillum sp.]|nr:CcdB family protein [Niveispirillum sp.]